MANECTEKTADCGTPEIKKQKLDADGQEIERNLALVEAIEDTIHEIENKKAAEVLKVEKKYDIQQEPYYKKRAEIIKNLPNFWTTAFMCHPQLGTLVEDMDETVFESLKCIDVEINEDTIIPEKTTEKTFDYKIVFRFGENEYFENTEIWKAFYRLGEDTLSENNTINWKEGKSLVKERKEEGQGDAPAEKTTPNFLEPESFFSWFSDHEDPTNDEVADTIKDDLYMNALNYYLNSNDEEDTKDEIDLEEEEEEEEDTENGE